MSFVRHSYGSTYNPNVRYSIPPPPPPPSAVIDDGDDFPLHLMAARNEYDGAMEDFTNAPYSRGGGGSGRDEDDGNDNEARIFPPAPAMLFAEAALVSDPIKARWHNLHQLNECHPSLVKVPTMVVRDFLLLPSPSPSSSFFASPRVDPNSEYVITALSPFAHVVVFSHFFFTPLVVVVSSDAVL